MITLHTVAMALLTKEKNVTVATHLLRSDDFYYYCHHHRHHHHHHIPLLKLSTAITQEECMQIKIKNIMRINTTTP